MLAKLLFKAIENGPMVLPQAGNIIFYIAKLSLNFNSNFS